MKISEKVSLSDVFFLGIFSILVFFGAFFIFSQLKESRVEKQVSMRSLEKIMNKKINQRMRKLQGKKILLKSKMNSLNYDKTGIDNSQVTNGEDSRYDLEIFDGSHEVKKSANVKVDSALEESLYDASYEDGNLNEKEDMVETYKEKIKAMAAERGWRVEVNNDLEIVNAEPIEKQ